MRVNCLGTGRSPVVGVEPAGHHSRERRANGGAEGVRTPDLFHAMEARSQLRHSPTLYRIPLILARVPSRLRRATRLGSRRFGGPWPHTGAAQISWRGSPLGYAERPAYAAAPLEKRGRPARAGLGAPGPIPALRKSLGAGPRSATPSDPLMRPRRWRSAGGLLAPVWGPPAPYRRCANLLARVPARLRRATRLCGRPAREARAACSRRFGGPRPHTGAAQISWRGSPLGYAERPAYAAAPLEKRGRPARAGLGAPGPIPALRKSLGAGPRSATPSDPLMRPPRWRSAGGL